MKGQDLELINITTCTDVQKIIQYYYYGLCVKYISNDGIESVEWISGRQLTYDTKRRHELVSITGDGVYYLKDRELFKNCVKVLLNFHLNRGKVNRLFLHEYYDNNCFACAIADSVILFPPSISANSTRRSSSFSLLIFDEITPSCSFL